LAGLDSGLEQIENVPFNSDSLIAGSYSPFAARSICSDSAWTS